MQEIIYPLAAVVVGLGQANAVKSMSDKASRRTHFRLCQLVVMMWEREINTAGVDIHIVSEDR